MLSPALLDCLRHWWVIGHAQGKILNGGWLFPGQNPIDPMSTRQLSRACHSAAVDAGIKKHVSMHTLRHNPEYRIMPSGVACSVCTIIFFSHLSMS